MEIPVSLPGFEGRGLTLECGRLFGGPILKAGGTAVPSEKRRSLVADNQGRQVEIKIKPRIYDPIPELEVDGKTVQLATPFVWHEYLWMGWPAILILQGGALGGAIGYAAYMWNTRVFRSSRGPLAKYSLTAAISFGAIAIFIVIAGLLQALIFNR